MINKLDYWALEYSFNQNTFFAAPLAEIINQNKQALLEGVQHDFIIIDLFYSKQDVEIYVEQINQVVKKKVIVHRHL